MSFEETANEIDKEDNQRSGSQIDKYKQYGSKTMFSSFRI